MRRSTLSFLDLAAITLCYESSIYPYTIEKTCNLRYSMIPSVHLTIYYLRTGITRKRELRHADAHTQYLPFNGGPRICIGQQFALTEIGFTVVRLLQKYERIDRYGIEGGGIKFKSTIVLSPAEDVRVGFWEVGKAPPQKA